MPPLPAAIAREITVQSPAALRMFDTLSIAGPWQPSQDRVVLGRSVKSCLPRAAFPAMAGGGAGAAAGAGAADGSVAGVAAVS
jgi:hypothetical protein